MLKRRWGEGQPALTPVLRLKGRSTRRRPELCGGISVEAPDAGEVSAPV
jgi:hypothetical protein